MQNRLICGIDEAGRGSVAGLYVISGVVLLKNIDGLDDSKKLTAKRREELYCKIIENSIYHIEAFSSKDVDQYGLSKLTTIALKKIIKDIDANRYIFDGRYNYGVKQIDTEIKADSLYKCVSAGSILSKVTHDLDMKRCNEDSPQYGFIKHKGYPTKEHKNAIKEYGYSKYHRVSYKLNI